MLTDNNSAVFTAAAKSNFRAIILKISYKQKSIDAVFAFGKISIVNGHQLADGRI